MAIQKNNFRRKFITQSLLIDSISYQLKNIWMFNYQWNQVVKFLYFGW